jgi:hypothetical protein
MSPYALKDLGICALLSSDKYRVCAAHTAECLECCLDLDTTGFGLRLSAMLSCPSSTFSPFVCPGHALRLVAVEDAFLGMVNIDLPLLRRLLLLLHLHCDSHSTSASTCLDVLRLANFTATAFPSHSPPCHLLCTSLISSLTFLPHLPLYPLIPICFPARVAHFSTYAALKLSVSAFLLRLPYWRYRWNRLIPYFPESPKTLQSDIFDSRKIRKLNSSTYQQQKQLSAHIVIP